MTEPVTRLSQNAKILFGTDTNTTPTEANNLTSWSFDKSRKEIDTTKTTSANHTYDTGIPDGKGSFEADIVVDSASQTMLEDAHKNNTVLYIFYRPDGTGTSKQQEKWPTKISSYSIKGQVDDKITVSVGFVATGAIDYTAQAAA